MLSDAISEQLLCKNFYKFCTHYCGDDFLLFERGFLKIVQSIQISDQLDLESGRPLGWLCWKDRYRINPMSHPVSGECALPILNKQTCNTS